MAGLFDSLAAATNALNAHRMGLDVAGQNLANVNTEGYSRRRLDLAELAPTDVLSAGRGVEIVGVSAGRDLFLEARLRQEYQGAGRDGALVRHLSELEAAFGLPGSSLDASLTAFFDAFSALATDPTSLPARDAVVRQAQELTRQFAGLTERLAASQRNVDGEIRNAVTEVNTLAATVARLNGQIVQAGPDAEALRDERALALNRLAELADVQVISRPDGAVDVTVASGRALVIGATGYAMATTPLPSGLSAVSIGGYDITSVATGGTLGGLLHVRDTMIPAYQSSLDQLAYDLATAVNGLHGTGFDLAGNPAADFFAPPVAVAGAAAALAVAPAVAANSALVAASASGAPGNPDIARSIAGLRDSRVMSGGASTPAEAWSRFVFAVASDLGSARAALAGRSQVVGQLENMRAQVSGVSVDEEAANLMRYQRAYEANARYFTTIVDTLDILMNMVR